MALLLDTHALIWFAQNDLQLPSRLADLISTSSDCYISRVSLWEVAIKVTTGKLKLSMGYAQWLDFVQRQNFELVEITDRQLRALTTLPLHHRDPFDRLLIAQAMEENLTLLSRDAHFAAYPVPVRW